MLATPICLLMSIYASFVYGKWDLLYLCKVKTSHFLTILRIKAILYANLESISIEFREIRGWSPVVASLPFVALLVGIFFAAAVNIYNNQYYFKQFQANGNRPVPEARLPPMMLGTFAFTAGLFLFACKSPDNRCWMSC